MMNQTTYRISEVCEVKSGKRLPKGMELSSEPTDYMYIRARDIKNGRILLDDVAFIDDKVKSKIKKYIISEGDVAITIVANIGDIGYCSSEADGANLTENAIRLTNFDKTKVDSKYLAYYLSRPYMKRYMEGLAAGAAQAKLGIYKINKMKIDLPNLETQKSIVEFADMYDELILNNTRRIAILKRYIDQLFKEYFVRTHGSNIGDQFDECRMGEICSFISRGITPDYVDEDGIVVINQRCIRDNSVNLQHSRLTSREKSINVKKYLKKDDILINSTGAGTLGRVAIFLGAEEQCTIDGHVTIVRVKKNISPIYVNYYLHSIELLLENLGRGTTNQLELSAKDLQRVKIKIPKNKYLLGEFERKARVVLEEVKVLEKKNDYLQMQLDSLLPRLMTGKIVL